MGLINSKGIHQETGIPGHLSNGEQWSRRLIAATKSRCPSVLPRP